MDIIVLGGDLFGPHDLCMVEDQEDDKQEPEMGVTWTQMKVEKRR